MCKHRQRMSIQGYYFQIIIGILIPNKKYKIHSRTGTNITDSLKNRNKEIRKIRKYKIHLRTETKNTENTEEQKTEIAQNIQKVSGHDRHLGARPLLRRYVVELNRSPI